MGVWQDLLETVIIVLIEALFVHLAAMLILRTSKIARALTVAAVATALAYLVGKLFEVWNLHELWIVFASLGIWLVTTGIVYRTTWVRSLAVAVSAFFLWWLTTTLVEFDWSSLF